MNVWAIIPVKSFALGKSRLATLLGPTERAELNRRLFQHVFATTVALLGAGRVTVVTADAGLEAFVREHKAHWVPDPDAGGLNAALAKAGNYACANGANAILVLPSDLPLLQTGDVDAMCAALTPAPACVIAPDTLELGTNALALSPPPPAPDFFRFGERSFAAHVEAARRHGMEPCIVRRPGLACDLDTPDDYRRLANQLWPEARSVVCAN